MRIIETGANPARTKGYQVRKTEQGTFELWLYRRGKLWAKMYFAPFDQWAIKGHIARFLAGLLRYHPMSMRGLG